MTKMDSLAGLDESFRPKITKTNAQKGAGTLNSSLTSELLKSRIKASKPLTYEQR